MYSGDLLNIITFFGICSFLISLLHSSTSVSRGHLPNTRLTPLMSSHGLPLDKPKLQQPSLSSFGVLGFVAVVVVVVLVFCVVLVSFFAALNNMHRDGGGKKRKILKYNSFTHAFTHFFTQ